MRCEVFKMLRIFSFNYYVQKILNCVQSCGLDFENIKNLLTWSEKCVGDISSSEIAKNVQTIKHTKLLNCIIVFSFQKQTNTQLKQHESNNTPEGIVLNKQVSASNSSNSSCCHFPKNHSHPKTTYGRQDNYLSQTL